MYAHTLLSSPTPWLSVLLPVHGVERWLPACARSLLTQDLQGVELVFLDDASPDGSAAHLARLEAANQGLVRVLSHQANRGLSAARNTLLEAARGEYLWFVDPDDVVEPGVVASLRRIVRRHAPDLVMCDYRVQRDDGSPLDRGDDHVCTFRGRSELLVRDRDELVRGLFRTGKLHAWSKIVRRGAWPAGLRFPEGRWFEDLAVVSRLLLSVESWLHAPEVWVTYRQRPGSILATLDARKLDDWMTALEGYASALTPMLPSGRTRRAVAHYCAAAWMRTTELADQLGLPDDDGRRRRWGRLWGSACPWPPARLERAYWLEGKFKRALRWRRWRRRAGL